MEVPDEQCLQELDLLYSLAFCPEVLMMMMLMLMMMMMKSWGRRRLQR